MKKEIVTRNEKIIFLPIWATSILALVASKRVEPPLSFLLVLLALVFLAVYAAFCMVLWRRMRRASKKVEKK